MITSFFNGAFFNGEFFNTAPAPAVGVDSHGSGGGRSSWEKEPGWAEYTQEKQRRYDEVFAKLLAAERAIEAAKTTIAARNKSQIYTARDRMRLAPLEARVAKLKVQLAKLEADLDEEHLIITLMVH